MNIGKLFLSESIKDLKLVICHYVLDIIVCARNSSLRLGSKP